MRGSSAWTRARDAAAVSRGETRRERISSRKSNAGKRLSSGISFTAALTSRQQPFSAVSERMPAGDHIGHMLRCDVLTPNRAKHATRLQNHDAVANPMHMPDVMVDDD